MIRFLQLHNEHAEAVRDSATYDRHDEDGQAD